MKHIELHILQSFPVSCLNRDDLNSPKTALFGGVQRARVSSQSWKRAIRELAMEFSPDLFTGKRTRLIIEPLRDALIEEGVDKKDALSTAKELANAIAIVDEGKKGKGKKDEGNKDDEKKDDEKKVKTLFFTTAQELKALARAYRQEKNFNKAVNSIYKKNGSGEMLKDAADIALFGRMVASAHTLTVEGAALFSHAISTHKVDNEIDFFSAVDDRQPLDEPGAGMTGTLEFNSATYYRFAALDLDMLKRTDHLGLLTDEERRAVVDSFLRATLMAVPGARRNSMNAATLPGYALCIVRGKGHPVQFVNAFERPIYPTGTGIFEASLKRIEGEYAHMNKTWGLNLDGNELASVSIPDKPLKEFLAEVLTHV